DSLSSDQTAELARAGGAQVIEHPFANYAAQRDAALDAVRDSPDWAVFGDADEPATTALAEAGRVSIWMPGCAGLRIPRDNYMFCRLTRGAGWYPDYETGLLKVGAAHYDATRQVHEVVMLDAKEGTLKNPFIHYNYRDLAQFVEKQRRYS